MKQKRNKLFFPVAVTVAIVILTVVGFARKCQQDGSTLADEFVRPGGDTLSVAIEMSALTYNMRNDTADGFDYQILCDIGRRHDVAMVFHPFNELEDAFAGLYNGTYDIVVASMASTSALKEVFPLTDAVYIDKQVLVQRGDSVHRQIKESHELRGDTVWIVEGSPSATRLRNMASELGDTIHIASIPGYSAEQLAIMTALGEVPRAVVNEAMVRQIAAEFPTLDISTPVSLSQLQCWAVAPGDSVLVDSLNSWLESFKKTAAFDSLMQRYLVAPQARKAEPAGQ